jgi:peptide/nickel transport system substrate-binding protein
MVRPNAPKLEELREAWPDASSEEEQKRIVRDMQRQTSRDVPLGQFFQLTAFGKTLTDIQMGRPVFHAVRRV